MFSSSSTESGLWNEKQGVWMGWERKRGKLGQFNRFLRGECEPTPFPMIVGDADRLSDGPLRHHARFRYGIAA